MVVLRRASQLRAAGLSPRAAQGRWPFCDHRSLAEVWGGAQVVAAEAVSPPPMPVPVPEKVQHVATLAEIRAKVDGAIKAKRAAEPTLPVVPPLPPKLAGAVAGAQAGHRIERMAKRVARRELVEQEQEKVVRAEPAETAEKRAVQPAAASPVLPRPLRPLREKSFPPVVAPAPLAEPDDEDFAAELAELAARIAAKRAARAAQAGPVAAKLPTNWGRVAAAHARKVVAPPVPAQPVRPLEPALSREECPRCGIPGAKGCAHQLPFAENHLGLVAKGSRDGARRWD